MKRQLELVKNMGLGWTIYRVTYEMRKKIGLLEKKYPATLFSDETFLSYLLTDKKSRESVVSHWKDNVQPFFEATNQPINHLYTDIVGKNKEQIINEANEVCDYTFTYFSKWKVKFESLDWHYSPVTKKTAPKDIHWMRIPDLAGEFGDIKFIWELSRFSFVYILVRAFTLTGDEKYVKAFWELVENWIKNNPNQLGVNYKCCQEMSIRVMSWIFGLYAFRNHKLSTDKRIFKLLKSIYIHSEHIEKHFEFSLKAVKNNHTITEAVAMYTVGLLFPFFNTSSKLKKKGLKHLQQEALKQIYKDGAYLQHSMNYHRLMLQDYTWAIQLGKLNNESFDKDFLERVKKAVLFLYHHQNNYNGKLPNYGMNDGALIHPLSTCDYLDYRPQINAAYYVLTDKRLYAKGIYDENLYWICGADALNSPQECIEKESKEFSDGGYYVLIGDQSQGSIRCATYKNRPFQADMLSLDLWWKGQNLLTDAGTFSYNTEDKWMTYFNGTKSHNTIILNNKDQMEKGSRFIWYKWLRSKVNKFEITKKYSWFEGEHYGYMPYVHKRAVCNIDDTWIIIDDVINDKALEDFNLKQQWLFGIDSIDQEDDVITFNSSNEKLQMCFLDDNSVNLSSYYGDKKEIRGWQSLYYGEKRPTSQIIREIVRTSPTRLITVIKHNNVDVGKTNEVTIKIGSSFIHLNDVGKQQIIKEIEV